MLQSRGSPDAVFSYLSSVCLSVCPYVHLSISCQSSELGAYSHLSRRQAKLSCLDLCFFILSSTTVSQKGIQSLEKSERNKMGSGGWSNRAIHPFAPVLLARPNCWRNSTFLGMDAGGTDRKSGHGHSWRLSVPGLPMIRPASWKNPP